MKTLSRILFGACLVSATALQAQTAVILPYGSTWRHLDDGSDQGVGWRAAGFDDSGWPSGPGQLGYGDGDEATVTGFIDTDPLTSGVQRNATTYFRTTFDVPDPGRFTSLSLTLLHDDAGAVFVNGIEVARTSNLAANASHNTFATSISADNATQTWVLSPSVLVAGSNSIAVEIHQASATSSDTSFDLQLTGASHVTRGPYLQMNNDSGVTVRWRTDSATDSVVWTGATPGALAPSATDAALTTEHEVRVGSIHPDTRYYYAVGSTAGILAGGDAACFFETAPAPGTDRATRIWVLGDAGTANSNQQAVRDAYYGSTAYKFNDMVLLLGDNAYNTGTDGEYQRALFDMYSPVLKQTPVWSCLGNHETSQSASGNYAGVPYFDIFSFPKAAECGGYPSGTERYYSWDFGNIHFISLDAQTTDATFRGNMLAWLDNDLAANTRRWTIAVWHHPPYTKGSHNSDTEEQLIWARENLVPRLEDAGVDLVLSGHSHSYERSKFIDGFHATPTSATDGTFLDAGSGRIDGSGSYGKDYGGHQGTVYAVPGSSGQISGGTLDHPVMFTSLNKLGSLVIDINGNRLDAKFINSTGAVDDYFTIEKGPVVSVSTPAPNAAEYGPVAGQLRVERSGSTASPLTVHADIGGSASAARFAGIPLPVTIPAGASAKTVDVWPQPDSIAQGAQTVTMTGMSNIGYRLAAVSSGTVTISDTPIGAPPIAAWQLAKFGAEANNEAIRGDDRDPDHDGAVNLLEYALGLEPMIASTADLPSIDTSQGYLALSVRKNPWATDVNFSIRATDNLTNAASWSSAGTVILQDTPYLLEVRDSIPFGSVPCRFMSLQVTRP